MSISHLVEKLLTSLPYGLIAGSAKVIIFGGYDASSKVIMNDVWSYDMITFTWSQIVPSNPTSPRFGHNCDITGANMVVYGGVCCQKH